MNQKFETFFKEATGIESGPYKYQARLAGGDDGTACESRLIDIPTGMGKTAAVVLAWLWNRVQRRDPNWPRRLVFCLPMRTLVEQTRDNAKDWLDKLGLSEQVGLEILMGGEDGCDWDLHPEKPTILVGTQDMLLSRALNRGYGMSRYRWPMHFGLLNNDCLWVLDETQLMGPGVWTSAQLDWLRAKRFPIVGSCPTWWMSATLGVSGEEDGTAPFLDTLDRRGDGMTAVPVVRLEKGEDSAINRLKAQKPVTILKSAPDAARILDKHATGTLTLVICNTVSAAQGIYRELKEGQGGGGDPVRLLTSRFRQKDRMGTIARLREFEEARTKSPNKALESGKGLVMVSTQVIEAGQDVSARRLWSEISPWSSTIQRLGRLNRDGELNGQAEAVFFPGEGGPYDPVDLKKAAALLKDLAKIQKNAAKQPFRAQLAQLDGSDALKPKPQVFPRAIDVHELFSNEPDLFGGFTDVSPFVRDADAEADVTVFWREFTDSAEGTGPAFEPDEGVRVRIGNARKFFKNREPRIWDDRLEKWVVVRENELCPGMLVLLPRLAGGYSQELGWTGVAKDRLDGPLPAPGPPCQRYQEDRETIQHDWQKLDEHLQEAEREAGKLKDQFASLPDFSRWKTCFDAVADAARWHDLGKALKPWQAALPEAKPDGEAALWAKAPPVLRVRPESEEAKEKLQNEVPQILADFDLKSHPLPDGEVKRGIARLRWLVTPDISNRLLREFNVERSIHAWRERFNPGFRHEVGSVLALWRPYFADRDSRVKSALALYLITAHHGKARTVLASRGEDGADVCGLRNKGDFREVSFGGETFPLDFEFAGFGLGEDDVPSYVEVISALLGGWERDAGPSPGILPRDGEPQALGPFALAFWETLVRVADARASEPTSQNV